MFSYTPAYPIHALSPLLHNAAFEVLNKSQAPQALVAGAVLAGASTCCQHLADVRLPTGQVCPISLAIMTIAESGERKTAVNNYFIKAIHQFQQEREADHRAAMKEYQSLNSAWLAERKGVERLIEKLSAADEVTTEAKNRLASIDEGKPEKPRKTKIVYNDTTAAALQHGLAEDSTSVALWTDEGGTVLGGRGVDNLPLLNSLWSSGSADVARRTSESFTVDGARMTLSVMTQRIVLEKFLTRKEGDARGTGFLARVLVAAPESTQGSRLVQSCVTDEELKCVAALQDWQKRMLEKGSHFSPPTSQLSFSPEARTVWLSFANDVERAIGTNGHFAAINDFASKLAEIAARLAAIFHLAEEVAGHEISKGHLESAITLCNWYAQEFKRVFAVDPQLISQQRAQALLRWLLEHPRSNKYAPTPRSTILQYGPSSVRTKEELDDAINQLLCMSQIFVSPPGRTKSVALNPNAAMANMAAMAMLPPQPFWGTTFQPVSF